MKTQVIAAFLVLGITCSAFALDESLVYKFEGDHSPARAAAKMKTQKSLIGKWLGPIRSLGNGNIQSAIEFRADDTVTEVWAYDISNGIASVVTTTTYAVTIVDGGYLFLSADSNESRDNEIYVLKSSSKRIFLDSSEVGVRMYNKVTEFPAYMVDAGSNPVVPVSPPK